MIEVTAAIIEEGDKFLIARRAKGKHLSGFWEFPGGKIEEGETAEACLHRELNEEFQINVLI
ncbi:NUDIX domain-containing protein [Polaribacter sp.]|nr:NUDIX domain-containing protein [Polaribacter sp.]